MENVGKEKVNKMELTITNIHAEDGYAYARRELIGKKFLASLTFSSTNQNGWYTIVGTMVDKTGIEILDNATDDEPIVISMAQYTL